MADDFVQIPPQSTGKKMRVLTEMMVDYNTGLLDLKVGMAVVLATSGVIGSIAMVDGDTVSGTLHMLIESNSPAQVAIVGELITVDDSTFATVAAASELISDQSIVIGSGHNPHNHLRVDRTGAANVRYTEGAPQFDAFGRMQVSKVTNIGEYIFQYDLLESQFTDFVTGSASISHLPLISGGLITTGTGAGDELKRISNRYHRYQAGISHLIEMTCSCGDSGKVGVTRRWGYGDDRDGIFFALIDDVLSIIVRNSGSGSVVETIIPQHAWNGDRVDGGGGEYNVSEHNIDVTKDNIWAFDFQWLGAGRVRFVVIIDGQRIVVHTQNHANYVDYPYMRTGTLPIYWSQTNTGSPASGSEMRVWAAVVICEGDYSPPEFIFSARLPNISIDSDTVPVHIGSFRSKQIFEGVDNRVSAYGDSFDVISTTAPILMELVRNATLTGSDWALPVYGESSMEADVVGTVGTDGEVICSTIVSNLPVTKDVTNLFNYTAEAMMRKADITQTDVYTFRATLLEAGAASTLSFGVVWKEVR